MANPVVVFRTGVIGSRLMPQKSRRPQNLFYALRKAKPTANLRHWVEGGHQNLFCALRKAKPTANLRHWVEGGHQNLFCALRKAKPTADLRHWVEGGDLKTYSTHFARLSRRRI
ncbi:hypothetical protein AVEN_193098-1 [Araneus ventricosus]|uniref:Uncharacterized protein n=1 Tax=Araneus ventricosus TaxID=182803 RepID=A0A4Y2B0I5_ARAVE|nr:hypothetical protein AVEN_193098-1 [Araneus ventricosus]